MALGNLSRPHQDRARGIAEQAFAVPNTRNWPSRAECETIKMLFENADINGLPERVARAHWNVQHAAYQYFFEVRTILVASGLDALVHVRNSGPSIGSKKQFVDRSVQLAQELGINFTNDDAAALWDHLTAMDLDHARHPTGYTPGVATKKITAKFVEPMLLLRSASLPDGDGWIREIKFDGYRALAFKSAGRVQLRSRNDNDMAARYSAIAKALARMPDDTVLDGKIIALDADGRRSFNLLQNYGSSTGPLVYFIFDLLVLGGRDLKKEMLETRRGLLEQKVIPKLAEPIRLSPALEGSMKQLIASVKESGLEGPVAKRKDSVYEPGLRTGAWRKMRVNLGQQFVIGGYNLSAHNFDAMIIGYYEGKKLIYSARVRNGFTPETRVKLFKILKPYERDKCPFANLPELKAGRWGAGLTAAKMKDCRWLDPALIAQFEFLEWSGSHLRHPHFVAMRDDKDPRKVVREA
jgi:DNA ligase D-like protein (predicted ligase)